MHHHHKSARIVAVTIALSALAILATHPAHASAPVPKTYVGCVLSGEFKNADGYVIRIRQQSGEPLNLASYQDKLLRISGNLLPGDIFYLTTPPVIVGPCR